MKIQDEQHAWLMVLLITLHDAACTARLLSNERTRSKRWQYLAGL